MLIGDILKDIQVNEIDQKISNILAREGDKILNNRQAIIKKFVDKLNEDREGKTFNGRPLKPLSASFVASTMYDSQLNTDRLLLWFFGYCSEAKNFSSCWWWSLGYGKH